MADNYEKYNETLKEQLELAGVPIEEAKLVDDETDLETDLESGFGAEETPETPETPEETKKEEPEKDEEDGEINDEWSSKINSKGEFKIEFYNNFIYVYYKNRRSQRISIDAKLKPYKKIVSKFVNKIFDHIEKKS